jgi:hypothetical protein
MLQCYVLTCGRSVTAFPAPPRSQRPGQGPRLPHPKAGPGYSVEKTGVLYSCLPPDTGGRCGFHFESSSVCHIFEIGRFRIFLLSGTHFMILFQNSFIILVCIIYTVCKCVVIFVFYMAKINVKL